MIKNERGASSIIGVIIVILLAAILGVMVYVFIFKGKDDNANYNANANTNNDEWEITNLNANNNANSNVNLKANGNTNNNPNGNVNSNKNGNNNNNGNTNQAIAEMGEETIVLANLGGDTKYSGTATKKFVNGNYTLIIETGMPEPTKGYFYAAWIERTLPYHFISLGKMQKSQGQYVMNYTSTTNYNNHPVVYITLELEDNDPAPTDQKVLIGRFSR